MVSHVTMKDFPNFSVKSLENMSHWSDNFSTTSYCEEISPNQQIIIVSFSNESKNNGELFKTCQNLNHITSREKRWTNKKIFYSLLFLPWEEFLLDSEYNKEGKLKLIRDFLCDFLLCWRVMSTHYKFLVSMPASSLLSICYRIPGSFLFLCQMVTLMEFASMKEKRIDSIVQWYSLGNVSNSKRISGLL